MTPKRKRDNARRIRRSVAVFVFACVANAAIWKFLGADWALALGASLLVVATHRLTMAVAIDRFDLRKDGK